MVNAVRAGLIREYEVEKFNSLVETCFPDSKTVFSEEVGEILSGVKVRFKRDIVIVKCDSANTLNAETEEECLWIVNTKSGSSGCEALTYDCSEVGLWDCEMEEVRPATEEEIRVFITDEFLRKIQESEVCVIL
ncbi:hypothetical protein ACFL08_01330 [Patescibacteria group bacterium]